MSPACQNNYLCKIMVVWSGLVAFRQEARCCKGSIGIGPLIAFPWQQLFLASIHLQTGLLLLVWDDASRLNECLIDRSQCCDWPDSVLYNANYLPVPQSASSSVSDRPWRIQCVDRHKYGGELSSLESAFIRAIFASKVKHWSLDKECSNNFFHFSSFYLYKIYTIL